MLQITNLHAEVDGKSILKGLTLALNPGEIVQARLLSDGALSARSATPPSESFLRSFIRPIPQG